MKERPILFSAPMVRAILEGLKTQTRRVMPALKHPSWTGYTLTEKKDGAIECGPDYPDDDTDFVRNPYGKPGDRLWVKEAWTFINIDSIRGEVCVGYNADGEALPNRPSIVVPEEAFEKFQENPPWNHRKRNAIFMPRWASRITLEIAEVRVQRLQDISEEDARDEGAEPVYPERMYPDEPLSEYHYTRGFHRLWDSINAKKHPWSSNPWVWAVSFKRNEEAQGGN